MYVPPAAAMPHGKLHPLSWNIGRVKRYTGCFGTAHSRRLSTVIIKNLR